MAQCFYCGKTVDRDTKKFVRIEYGKVFRYAHIECYEQNKEKEKRTCEIIDPQYIVSCIYCKKTMKKTDVDCKAVNSQGTKFAHILCIEQEKLRPKTPEELLDLYIISLFNLEYVPPVIQTQKDTLIKKYGFTYSGIHGSLKYFYEIKQNRPDLKKPSIMIVAYIYNEAKEYYAKIQKIKEINNKLKPEDFIDKTVEITIQKPKRNIVKKNLFSFLDKEEQ